jgi:hypothetical protein
VRVGALYEEPLGRFVYILLDISSIRAAIFLQCQTNEAFINGKNSMRFMEEKKIINFWFIIVECSIRLFGGAGN